jgi:hypothetical protein
MPRPSHPPWLDHPSNIWWSVQVMQLLIMQCSQVSLYMNGIRSRYSGVLAVPSCFQWPSSSPSCSCISTLAGLAPFILVNVHLASAPCVDVLTSSWRGWQGGGREGYQFRWMTRRGEPNICSLSFLVAGDPSYGTVARWSRSQDHSVGLYWAMYQWIEGRRSTPDSAAAILNSKTRHDPTLPVRHS